MRERLIASAVNERMARRFVANVAMDDRYFSPAQRWAKLRQRFFCAIVCVVGESIYRTGSHQLDAECTVMLQRRFLRLAGDKAHCRQPYPTFCG